MPPRTGRIALQERYDRRRADVVEAAAAVFAERGYDQTSVPELAEALGMASGGLYHYFAGKQDLLIAICDELMRPLLEVAETLPDEDASPEAQLRDLVHLWVAHVVAHRDHMLLFQQERHQIEHGAQWRRVRDDRKRFEQVAGRILRRAAAAGLTRLDDERMLLSALLGMVNHTAQWYRPRGRLTPAEIADGYVDLIITA